MEISCYLEQKDDSNIVTISDVFPDSPGEMCYNELAMRESTEDCHMADACLLNWQITTLRPAVLSLERSLNLDKKQFSVTS